MKYSSVRVVMIAKISRRIAIRCCCGLDCALADLCCVLSFACIEFDCVRRAMTHSFEDVIVIYDNIKH